MAIRPLHDRVVIKRLEAEEKTASGIVFARRCCREAGHGRSDCRR